MRRRNGDGEGMKYIIKHKYKLNLKYLSTSVIFTSKDHFSTFDCSKCTTERTLLEHSVSRALFFAKERHLLGEVWTC